MSQPSSTRVGLRGRARQVRSALRRNDDAGPSQATAVRGNRVARKRVSVGIRRWVPRGGGRERVGQAFRPPPQQAGEARQSFRRRTSASELQHYRVEADRRHHKALPPSAEATDKGLLATRREQPRCPSTRWEGLTNSPSDANASRRKDRRDPHCDLHGQKDHLVDECNALNACGWHRH